jgi:hypothetical protein
MKKKQETEDLILESDLNEIMYLVHFGGLIDLNDNDCALLIRKITLKYFDSSSSIDETKQILNQIKNKTI